MNTTTMNTMNQVIMTKESRTLSAVAERMSGFKTRIKKVCSFLLSTEHDNPYDLSPEMQSRLYL